MIRYTGYALALAFGLSAANAQSGSLSLDAEQLPVGKIEYVSTSALEIGIAGRLFRLDSGFQIHGLPGKDRLQQLGGLKPGMNVQYRGSGADADSGGVIRELWVQPD